MIASLPTVTAFRAAAVSAPLREQAEASQQEQVDRLDLRIAGLEKEIHQTEERIGTLESAVEDYKSFDRTMQWSFLGGIAAAVAGGAMLGSAPLVLGGLVFAAGTHLARVFSSGRPVALYGDIIEARSRIQEHAGQVAEAAREREDLKRRFAETLEMLDGATGRLAGRLGIQEQEETVSIGGVTLTRRTRVD